MDRASIIITTKNRVSELVRSLQSALAQKGDHEVIVIDDGSTDETSATVARDFPRVRLVSHKESAGLVVRRNQAASLASNPFLVSLDDDAVFSRDDIVSRTLGLFDHPRIGAVAIPFVNVNASSEVLQKAPDERRWITDTFIGTAHALRRDVFLRLGGYREGLIHQGEESDFCIRLLDGGFFVRLGNSEPIHHNESLQRNLDRMNFYGCRNAVLFAWQNAPLCSLPFHMVGTTLKTLMWDLSPKRLPVRARGLAKGWMTLKRGERLPVRTTTYRLFRRLRKKGPLPMDDLL